jgi:hypothetical protein
VCYTYYSSNAICFDHSHTANPEAKAHLKDLGMDGCEDNIKFDFNKSVKKACTGLIWLGIQTSGGLLEQCNKHLRSSKWEEFD